MALNATNVANSLIDTLNKLSNADTVVMSREAGVVVANLQNLCIILADSAEVAAEAPGTSPLVREDYANFANEITGERMILEELRLSIGNGAPASPAITKRLVESAKKIAHLTSEMILLTEGANVRRIVEEAKTLARWARAVIVGVNEQYETFMANCQSYGQASVTLARSLKEYLNEIKDAHHKAQVSRAYEDLREACPRVVQTAAKCFDSPGNLQLNEELQNAGKELAGKIGYAISVAHPPNVSTGMAPAGRGVSQAPSSAAPIPITLAPEEQPQADNKARKRTVREAGHGTDILNRY